MELSKLGLPAVCQERIKESRKVLFRGPYNAESSLVCINLREYACASASELVHVLVMC